MHRKNLSCFTPLMWYQHHAGYWDHNRDEWACLSNSFTHYTHEIPDCFFSWFPVLTGQFLVSTLSWLLITFWAHIKYLHIISCPFKKVQQNPPNIHNSHLYYNEAALCICTDTWRDLTNKIKTNRWTEKWVHFTLADTHTNTNRWKQTE